MWLRAIGRSTPIDAPEPTTKTTRSITQPPPRAAAIDAAIAATAIGPRKKRPGVRISPIASRTATRAQASHAATPRS